MNVISRGVRNAFRNSVRTLSIVIILGLSIGLALSMGIARGAVQQKIASVKASVGNTISLSPAGSRGFEGGGNPLTDAQLAKVQSLAHVTAITETLSARLTTSDTNLVSAINAGSLGARFASSSGVTFSGGASGGGFGGASGGSGNFSFTPPVELTGTNNVTNPTVYNATSVKITSGQAFNPSLDSNVAIVGASLAAKNNLKIGSTFTVYGSTVQVVAIYDAGNTFANGGLIMPLATVQRLSSQSGDITGATVTVDSIDNLSSVATAITNQLGSSVVDVVSSQQASDQAIAPLQNITTVSLYSLIGSIVAGAVIILLIMVMIVRERRREVGVLKAIGASNTKITIQFMSEAVTFTLLGAVVGLLIGVVGSNPITKVLVTNANNNTTTSSVAGISATTAGHSHGFGDGAGAVIRGLGISGTNLNNIHAVVGWGILLDGLGAALLIAIVGSAIPALLISKIRPAEVIRSE